MQTDKTIFHYKLRPGYGSKNLLLEFDVANDLKSLVETLKTLLQENGFVFVHEDEDVFGEPRFIYASTSGEVSIDLEEGGLVFIIAEQQQDILKVDRALLESGLFAKTFVNYSDYKKA